MTTGQDYFVFDGVDSRSFDCMVFEKNTFQSAQRDYTTTVIPGKSGDFILNGDRFGNVDHEYDVIIPRRFEDNFEQLRAYLLSRTGYRRLEDSLHPNEYYYAYITGPIEPVLSRDRQMGKFSLRFSRKPQRYLLSGDTAISIRANGSWAGMSSSAQYKSITNPTRFQCYPLLSLAGSSLSSGFDIWVNGTRVYMSAYSGSNYSYLNSYPLMLDFESLMAYVTVGSSKYYYNSAIHYVMPSDHTKAFKLSAGSNTITQGSNTSGVPNVQYITTMTLTPRWFTL